MMIMMWRCWQKLPLWVFFPSILYGLVIISWLTEMKFKKLAKHYSDYGKVTDIICYSQNVNLAFIEHTSILIYVYKLHIINKHMYILYIMLLHVYIYIYIHSCHFLCIVTFIMFICFLKTIQSFHIIIFSQKFLVLLGQSLIEKTSQFMLKTAESFFVILGLILAGFLRITQFSLSPWETLNI